MKVGEIYKLTDDNWRVELESPGHVYVLEIGEAVCLALAILWRVLGWHLRRLKEW